MHQQVRAGSETCWSVLSSTCKRISARMPARIFLSGRTARFDLGLAGVAFATLTGRRWPLLAALPYARRSLRTWDPWTASAVRENAALVAGDLVSFASLAEGSARARTLVL